MVSPQIENDVLIEVTIIYIFVHEMSYTVVYYYREPYHTCSKLLFHFINSFFNQCFSPDFSPGRVVREVVNEASTRQTDNHQICWSKFLFLTHLRIPSLNSGRFCATTTSINHQSHSC